MIALALLIGGRGRRLGGVDKASLELEGGGTSGERLLATFAPLVQEMLLVGRDDQRDHPLSRSARFVADRAPDEGPLRAIATALHASRAPWVFVVGCDLTGLGPDDLTSLAKARGRGRLAIGFRSPAGMEPLCALYHRAMASIADGMLARGERRARALLEGGRLHHRDAAIGNINTPAELTALRARLPSG